MSVVTTMTYFESTLEKEVFLVPFLGSADKTVPPAITTSSSKFDLDGCGGGYSPAKKNLHQLKSFGTYSFVVQYIH